MALSGPAHGPPVLAPAAFAAAIDGAVRALGSCAPESDALASLDAPGLLGERAAAFGHRRAGASSPGGSCRLLATRDGRIALALARDDDVASLDALFECERGEQEAWAFAAERTAARTTDACLERARWLGIACADAIPAARPRPPWLTAHRIAPPCGRKEGARTTRVLDLSALWAGPLAANLLGLAGAEVVKVESTQRPDGARNGPASLFDALNTGKRSVALDLGSNDGIAALRRLIGAGRCRHRVLAPARARAAGHRGRALSRREPRLELGLDHRLRPRCSAGRVGRLR